MCVIIDDRLKKQHQTYFVIYCIVRMLFITKTKNLYSQINHTLQWYRGVTYTNTTQHVYT
jgi:hypothetical protein